MVGGASNPRTGAVCRCLGVQMRRGENTVPLIAGCWKGGAPLLGSVGSERGLQHWDAVQK